MFKSRLDVVQIRPPTNHDAIKSADRKREIRKIHSFFMERDKSYLEVWDSLAT